MSSNNNKMLSLLLNDDSDKFEVFMTQKMLVAKAKKVDVEYQDSLKLITEVLVKAASPGVLCRGLEMLRQLLKKTNIHWRAAVKIFKDVAVHKFADVAIMDAASSYFTDCCIYEVLYVCHKILKLVPLYDCHENDASYSLKDYLHEKHQILIDKILFSSHFLNFVKRMLLKFLTKLFMCASINRLINSVAREMAARLVLVTKRFDMQAALSQPGVTCFVGVKDGGEVDDYQGYNPTHIREWMCMCTQMEASMNQIEGSSDGNTGGELLLSLDEIVQNIISSADSSLPFSFLWLPEIFGEQDDMWMDMLILLMKVYPRPKVKGQHHFQFLQVVASVGYDHVIVLDLLTSPETRCREYLLLYLRHLIHTWDDFVKCAHLLDEYPKYSNEHSFGSNLIETENKHEDLHIVQKEESSSNSHDTYMIAEHLCSKSVDKELMTKDCSEINVTGTSGGWHCLVHIMMIMTVIVIAMQTRK